MIPWNPIHRYAGMTSLFDSLDEQQAQARLDGWGETPQPNQPERAPLGFIDVRAEAALDDGESDESASEGSTVDESDVVPAAPAVEFAAVGDSELAVAEPEAHEGDSDPAESSDKVPFFKREISFGRKKSAPALESSSEPEETEQPDSTETMEEIAEREPKVPFFKRELSFRRSSDSDELEEFTAALGHELSAPGPEY